MIFVDTGAWFASFVVGDPDHHSAIAWRQANNKVPLLTTGYVVDELLTLLRAREEFEKALEVGPKLLNQELAVLELISSEDINEAWEVIAQFHDKEWSFTDCVSRVVMQRLNISKAFAFDNHFRQFGTVSVLP